MIDTHCHLDVAAFDADRDEVLARAERAGVRGVLVPAIRPGTWPQLIAWARRFPSVRLAIGIHPQVVPMLGAAEKHQLDTLAETAAEVGAAAIGECGLDAATGQHEEQESIFRAHVRAARALRLPLVVHVLRAHDAAPRILAEERAGDVGGVMHSYSGGRDLVARYAALNFHFSFAGPVTWAGARRPVEAARVIARDRLLVETDAPDQAPEPHRGGRCEPAYVADVVRGLARVRAEDVAEVAAYTDDNATRLFGFPRAAGR